MNLIISPFSTLQENLSLEQYLLTQKDEFALIYINDSCLAIGRNQVIYSEIDIKYQQLFNLPLIRRLSGGGAVLNDNGILNYAFITNYDKNKSTYSRYNQILIHVLSEIGLSYLNEKGCNIYYKDFKISGTAQYKKKDRIIHHGTLLIDANLNLLRDLFIQSIKYKTKAKRSQLSPTINLTDICPDIIKNELEKLFCKKIEFLYCRNRIYLDSSVYEYIAKNKMDFENISWTFGNSPNYIYNNEISFPDNSFLKISFEVKKGKVTSQYLTGNNVLSSLNFVGYYHSYEDFFPLINNVLGGSFTKPDVNIYCYKLFQ